MLPAGLTPASTLRLREQTAEEFEKRAHPFYFKGQIDNRRNYALRARVGEVVGELASKLPELTRGGMYVATPYQHGDPAHWLKSLHNCSCPQAHGMVTKAASDPKAVCINCVERRDAPTGQNHSPKVNELLSTNPYASDIPESRFAFHISGDLPSSNRIFDVLKVGAIPLTVSRQLEMTLPFADVVPWKDIMFRLPTYGIKKEIVEELLALGAASKKIAAVRGAILKHTPDVLWDAAGTRVTTNILLTAARHCLQHDVPYPKGVTPNKFKRFEGAFRDAKAYAWMKRAKKK